MMNQYGTLAERHWKTHLPSRYATIENPTSFFDELGEQISDQIHDLADTFAGADPDGESYLDKVGRLNMARLRAREQVLAEMLPTPENEEQTAAPSTR